MAVAPALIDLGVLFALIVLIGLSYAYRYTLGALIQTLVAALDSVRLPSIAGFGGGRIFGFLADGLDALDHTIRHALGRGIEDMQAAWNQAASYTAHAIGWIGREIASLSHDTAQAVEGLAARQVPRWVLNRLAAGLAAIAALKASVIALEHAGVKRIERVTHVVTHRVTVIERAVAHPDIGAIPRAIPRIDDLTQGIDDLKGRFKQFAKTLTPAGIVGLVGAAVFSQFGLGWLKCSNVNKVGKSVCGMNHDVLEGLLAGLLALFGTFSLVEFAKFLQPVVGEVGGEVTHFWRADVAGQSRDRELGAPSLTAL